MIKKILKWFLKFFSLFLLFTVLVILLIKWINPPTTAFIQKKDNSHFESILSNSEIIQKWVPLKSISPSVVFALIASEDQRFFQHYGFDLIEIRNSIIENIDGSSNRGGSTLTQQLTKNLFLWKNRSYIRKGLELYYSILSEIILGKKRILELYLNTAQFGANIYGIEAAANYYFKKPAQYISFDEAAELISILPNPITLDLKGKTPYLNNRIKEIGSKIQKMDLEKIVHELE